MLGYHLLLMKAGGFDGASMSWYGVGSQEDRASQAIFDKANAWAGKYGFDFSLDLMPDADPYKGLPADEKVRRLTADVKAILARYASTPAYQRLGGKPILYFFPKPDPATGETTITPAMWAQVKANVGQPFDLVMESHNTAMNGVKDGDYGWIETGKDPAQLNTAYLDWLYNSFAHDDPSQVVHMGVVYAGFDDVGVHAWTNDPNARRLIDRTMGGEATLQKTWDQVNAFNAAHPATPVSWVETATWNDWNEGSEIEPSVEEGDKELQLAARNNAAFKGTQAASQAAFQFPARYLALRHAGYSDDQLGAAIAAFCAGRYDQALSLLPAN